MEQILSDVTQEINRLNRFLKNDNTVTLGPILACFATIWSNKNFRKQLFYSTFEYSRFSVFGQKSFLEPILKAFFVHFWADTNAKRKLLFSIFNYCSKPRVKKSFHTFFFSSSFIFSSSYKKIITVAYLLFHRHVFKFHFH